MAIENPVALEVRQLTHRYGDAAGAVTALDNVDSAFQRGTFTAVMGPSGSGKSTLLACAAGLESPVAGSVLLAGEDITGWDESRRAELRSGRIGLVFQQFHLMPYLTVAQNVELPMRLAGKRVNGARVKMLLDRVGLGDRGHVLPTKLSGGQQQRVAIARALVAEPDVILADEPTGALDSVTAASVLTLLRESVDGLGQTVVMVTHDPVAAARADSVMFLVDGRIVGRMNQPTAEAVAGQMSRLDELVAA